MFVDLVKLKVVAGTGGDGIVAFRREKYVPMGGPAGGSGGKGGDLIFIAEEGLSTLLELRYNKIVKASYGENGMPKGMHGKGADDTYIKVPVGTTIFDHDTGKIIGDLTSHKEEIIVAKGGRGGRGNIQFATTRHPAPEICEKGEPGVARNIRVELKVLADVGLVGFPSVGKSTLISVVSKAKPKIADYHFTTLKPNLGVVGVGDKSFVMADLPGLIEGASTGSGLGHQFLRHIERTKVIIHIVDISGMEGRDPVEDFHLINKELEQYNLNLLSRPQIIALNKSDLTGSDENYEKFINSIKGYPIVKISAATHEGIEELLYKTLEVLERAKEVDLYSEEEFEGIVEYNFTKEDSTFSILLADDNVYEIHGDLVEKLFKMTDFSKDQSVKRFSRQLRSMGVDDALREKGVQHGDVVRILDYEFDFLS
ncbi:GTPase ObgE [Mycoplasmatota bacterium zrk1]